MKRKCLSLWVILVTLLSLTPSQPIPSQLQSPLDTPAYLDQYETFLKSLSEKGQLYQSIQENIIVRPSALQIQQLKALLDQAQDLEAQFNRTVNSKKTDPTVTLITRAQLFAKQIQVKRLLSQLIAALSSWIYKYDAQNPGNSSATLTTPQPHIYQQSGLPQPALISSQQAYVQMPPSQPPSQQQLVSQPSSQQHFIPQPSSQPVLQPTQQSNVQPQQPPLLTRVISQPAQPYTPSPLPIQVQPIFLSSFLKQPQASSPPLKLNSSSMTPADATNLTQATPQSASSVPHMANIVVSKPPSTIITKPFATVPPMKAQVIVQSSIHTENQLLTPEKLQNQEKIASPSTQPTPPPISMPINVTIKPSAQNPITPSKSDQNYSQTNSTQLKQQASSDSPLDDAKNKQTPPDSTIEQASSSIDSKSLSNRREAKLLVASGAGAAIAAVALTAGVKLGAAHHTVVSSTQTTIPRLINSFAPINPNQTIPNYSNASNVVGNVTPNTSNALNSERGASNASIIASPEVQKSDLLEKIVDRNVSQSNKTSSLNEQLKNSTSPTKIEDGATISLLEKFGNVSAEISNKLHPAPSQASPEYYSYKKRFEQMEIDMVSFNESAQAIFQSKYQHQTLTPEEIQILSAVYDEETRLETEGEIASLKISFSGGLSKEQKAKLSRSASALLQKQKELRMSLEVVMHSFREQQVKTDVEARQAVLTGSRAI